MTILVSVLASSLQPLVDFGLLDRTGEIEMARIALVTPADANSPSVKALSDELAGFGYDVQDEAVLKVYSGANNISRAAQDAVQAVDAKGVLVAAGEMAATAVQAETAKTAATATIPIIMAFGGGIPANAADNKNMTGFFGDCKIIAQDHLKALKKDYGADQITVLYDKDGEDPPFAGGAPKNKVTNDILHDLKKTEPKLHAKSIDTTNITRTQIANLLTDPGFMMIPNAVFFEQADAITSAVDSSTKVVTAYYPEVHYYNKSDKTKKKAKFSGFNVPATYRIAASWVNYILSEIETVQTIVQKMNKQFAEAIPEPYLVPSKSSFQGKGKRGKSKRSAEF